MPVRYLLCAMLLALMVVLVGCPKPQETSQTPPSSLPSSPATGAKTAPGTGGEEMATCPVLGTTMPKSKMIPVEYEGKTYYLCCQDCVPKFKAEPKKYIEHPAKPLPPSSGM
jgi:YHS domain-containing protein